MNGTDTAMPPPPRSNDGETRAAEMPSEVDDQLMIGIQNGNPRAFDALVARHQGPLIGFFCANAHDRQLAEDLTQETLLRVYNQAWDYLPTGRFQGWLYRIARNLLIDTVRRHSHDAVLRALKTSDAEQTALRSLMHAVASPVDQAGERELGVLVKAWLQELPAEQRETFTLHHFSGLTLPEVADILKTSVATTKSRLRLVREKLQEKLRLRGVGGLEEA